MSNRSTHLDHHLDQQFDHHLFVRFTAADRHCRLAAGAQRRRLRRRAA